MLSEFSKSVLGASASFCVITSYVIYCRDIFKGKTKPHAFSWLLWSILGTIGFFGQRADGAGAGSWLLGVVTISCILIFPLSIKYGEKNITKFDLGCLGFAALAILLWIFSDTPLWSIVLVSIIDGVAFLPTYRKTWRKPDEETLVLYQFSGISFFISLLALENVTLITALYPTVLVMMNAGFVLLVLIRRHSMRSEKK